MIARDRRACATVSVAKIVAVVYVPPGHIPLPLHRASLGPSQEDKPPVHRGRVGSLCISHPIIVHNTGVALAGFKAWLPLLAGPLATHTHKHTKPTATTAVTAETALGEGDKGPMEKGQGAVPTKLTDQPTGSVTGFFFFNLRFILFLFLFLFISGFLVFSCFLSLSRLVGGFFLLLFPPSLCLDDE